MRMSLYQEMPSVCSEDDEWLAEYPDYEGVNFVLMCFALGCVYCFRRRFWSVAPRSGLCGDTWLHVAIGSSRSSCHVHWLSSWDSLAKAEEEEDSSLRAQRTQ